MVIVLGSVNQEQRKKRENDSAIGTSLWTSNERWTAASEVSQLYT